MRRNLPMASLAVRQLFIVSALLSWRLALCHYGAGWDASHSGSQIWMLEGEGDEWNAAVEGLKKNVDVLHQSWSSLQVVVPSHRIEESKLLLQDAGLQYTVQVEDLAHTLMEQHKADLMHAAARASSESCTEGSCPRPLLEEYMSFEQVEWFLEDLKNNYSDHVAVESVGKTEEGRDLWLVTIAKNITQAKLRLTERTAAAPRQKAVFVEGGAHAREWISPATSLHIIIKIVDACATGGNCPHLYYFMPLLNPDGYQYTRSTYRCWRKSRSPPPAGSSCIGTDLNRNWSFKWGGAGSSSDPCSDSYRGTAPFSAPELSAEMKTIQTIVRNVNIDLVAYISYHSYSQLVLFPWGYATEVQAPDHDDMEEASFVYSNAVRIVHNKLYTVQQSAGLYPAAGSSEDYTKSIGVKYPFVIELRDEGTHGFALPADQIQPTMEENWAGFTALMDHVTKHRSLLSKCEKLSSTE